MSDRTEPPGKCPECGCPNGWHAWPCQAGIAVVTAVFKNHVPAASPVPAINRMAEGGDV